MGEGRGARAVCMGAGGGFMSLVYMGFILHGGRFGARQLADVTASRIAPMAGRPLPLPSPQEHPSPLGVQVKGGGMPGWGVQGGRAAGGGAATAPVSFGVLNLK